MRCNPPGAAATIARLRPGDNIHRKQRTEDNRSAASSWPPARGLDLLPGDRDFRVLRPGQPDDIRDRVAGSALTIAIEGSAMSATSARRKSGPMNFFSTASPFFATKFPSVKSGGAARVEGSRVHSARRWRKFESARIPSIIRSRQTPRELPVSREMMDGLAALGHQFAASAFASLLAGSECGNLPASNE